jgi:hypothetical protein
LGELLHHITNTSTHYLYMWGLHVNAFFNLSVLVWLLVAFFARDLLPSDPHDFLPHRFLP